MNVSDLFGTAEALEATMAMVGAITGIVGLVISLCAMKRNKTIAVHEFLSKMEDESFMQIRNNVYKKEYDKICDIGDNDAATLINFFHHWGLLVKKHYLPMWVFDGASGNGACRLYDKVEPYIRLRREIHNDEKYGEYFEWLYKKLKKTEKRRNRKQTKK